MNTLSHYQITICKYKSVILRITFLFIGLFFINHMQAQVGDVCETPINITSLPFSAAGTITDYGNDYTNTDVPPAAAYTVNDVPFNANFLKASEVVYSYVASDDGYLAAIVLASGNYSSIYAFSGCPFQSSLGWDYSVGAGYTNIAGIPVSAGETYYFVVSGALPAATFDFSFQLIEYEGNICEAPIEIHSLPISQDGENFDYGNDYGPSDVPPASADAIFSVPYDTQYMNGSDAVYSYTPIVDGYIDVSLDADEDDASIWVLTGCPFESAIAWGRAYAQGVSVLKAIPITAGQTYCFVVSSEDVTANFTYTLSVKISEGLICESPIEISSIPYSHQGHLLDYGNDYFGTGAIPPPIANPISDISIDYSIMNGPEVVYAYTPTDDGFVSAESTADLENSTMMVFTGCNFNATIGWDYQFDGNLYTREIKNIPVLGGETYYFVLSSTQFSSNNDYTYTLTLKASAGTTCDPALEISELPFQTDPANSTTQLYGNNYTEADVPATIPNPIGSGDFLPNYLNGYDVVYSYTPETYQLVKASLNSTGSSMALWVFTGCPFELTHAWDNTDGPGFFNYSIENIPLQEGETYYFVISSSSLVPSNFSFELKAETGFDCPNLFKDFGDPCNDMDNSTVGDHVTEECLCEGYQNNASINLTIPNEGSCGLRDVVLNSFVANSNVLISTISVSNENSNTIVINDMPVGTFDIYIKIEGTLQVLLFNYDLNAGVNNIQLSNLKAGDLTGSNSINIADFSLFVLSFGAVPGDSNYNALANINCDSSINVADLSLLGSRFGLQGLNMP